MAWSIKELEVSTYDSKNRSVKERKERPGWPDIHQAILSLDAEKRSCMSLTAEDGSVLTIGGGKVRYTASVMQADGSGSTLVDPEHGDEKDSIMIGGQVTNLSRRYIVEESTMVRAASRFARDGELDPESTWEDY